MNGCLLLLEDGFPGVPLVLRVFFLLRLELLDYLEAFVEHVSHLLCTLEVLVLEFLVDRFEFGEGLLLLLDLRLLDGLQVLGDEALSDVDLLVFLFQFTHQLIQHFFHSLLAGRVVHLLLLLDEIIHILRQSKALTSVLRVARQYPVFDRQLVLLHLQT